MGTNYYWTADVCDHCGRGADQIHIGKSSAGWCFALHVDPDNGINSLNDWQERWAQPRSEIRDEYDQLVPPAQMLSIITERSWPHTKNMDDAFYRDNHAEPGPRGLARHFVDGRHCVGHGDGTYDLIAGEFS